MVAGLRKYRFLPRSPRCIAKGLVVFHPRFPNAKENICCRHWNEPHSKTVHERLSFVVALTPPGSATVTCTNSARLATFGVDSGAFFAKRSPIRSAGIATVAMANPAQAARIPPPLGICGKGNCSVRGEQGSPSRRGNSLGNPSRTIIPFQHVPREMREGCL
jgi:hypothetical protein